MKHSRRQAAFTIIELLVVLVIAALAMAVAVPGFDRGLTSMHLKSATRDISSALRYTRTRALGESREAEFFINVQQRFYRVSGRSRNFPLPDDLDYSLFTADSEIVGDEGGRIRFFPDGSSTGGRVTVMVDDRKRQIDVNWLTGQVNTRIVEGEQR